jgi:hypothetical protein
MSAPQSGPQSTDVTTASTSGDGSCPTLPQHPGRESPSLEGTERRSYRRVFMITCENHGATGFTNLLVTKEDGFIVLNPHLGNCCVLRLDKLTAITLGGIFREWLGS